MKMWADVQQIWNSHGCLRLLDWLFARTRERRACVRGDTLSITYKFLQAFVPLDFDRLSDIVMIGAPRVELLLHGENEENASAMFECIRMTHSDEFVRLQKHPGRLNLDVMRCVFLQRFHHEVNGRQVTVGGDHRRERAGTGQFCGSLGMGDLFQRSLLNVVDQREHVFREIFRVLMGDVDAVAPFDENVEQGIRFSARRAIVRSVLAVGSVRARNTRQNETIGNSENGTGKKR